MKAKVLITAVVILSLAIAVLINILMTIEPEIIHEIETVPTYIIEHETVVVEKPVYVEVIVYEPLELRPFESWQELAVWQGQNYIKDVEENGCVDAALELQMKALKDGYLMSTEITGVIPLSLIHI